MKLLLLIVALSAPLVPTHPGNLRVAWAARNVVVASFELKAESTEQISSVLFECLPSEVRFEFQLRQNRKYWPDSVVARTLVRNRVRCEADSSRVLTRYVDGVVVDTMTTSSREDVLRFVSRTGEISAFPGLTDRATRMQYSIELRSTVLSNDREVLSARNLGSASLSPK